MTLAKNHLELLAPARDVTIGKEAVLHGADAVYIGGPVFGARVKADNTVADIASLVAFAHRFRAKIFVTLNTILHDSEIEIARDLVHQYWNAGVDALIVQDMSLLKMDIPPIALHASTQCDIRTVEKAKFLGDVGFSQLVLAREMTLQDIAKTRSAVNPEVPLEFFVHGALCVAFSGNCSISHAHTGRSANRGECAQECRLPYTLKDKDGAVVAFDKHLLSMKDNNQSLNLRALVEAGIRSFKIEGRYKDMGYVKNVTAHYRQLFDEILNEKPELARCSDGVSTYTFAPNASKSFNRDSTDYFVNGRREDIGAFDAPVHRGELVGVVCRVDARSFDLESAFELANGDGLTYMHKRELRGMQVNTAQRIGEDVWRIVPNVPIGELPGLAEGASMHRNRDHAWDMALTKTSASRKIPVDATIRLADNRLTLEYAIGADCAVAFRQQSFDVANDETKAREQLSALAARLGDTDFTCARVTLCATTIPFVPASLFNAMRREAVEQLVHIAAQKVVRDQRLPAVQPRAQYPSDSVSFLDNVYNALAREFYSEHGVKMIAAAYESHEEPGDVPLMVTKHCLRFSFNLCPKQAKGVTGVQGQVRAEPMTLESAGETLTLKFDCKPCEMHVMGKMRSKIFRAPPPSVAPMKFFEKRPTAV